MTGEMKENTATVGEMSNSPSLASLLPRITPPSSSTSPHPTVGPTQSSAMGNTTVHTGTDPSMTAMFAMMMGEMKAQREESKAQREEDKKRMDRLQEMVMSATKGKTSDRLQAPVANTPIGLFTPTSESPSVHFGTGLRSAEAQSIKVRKARRSLDQQLGVERGVEQAEDRDRAGGDISPSDEDSEDENEGRRRDKAESDMIKGARPPELFSGDESKQRITVRTWVLRMDDYMDLYLGERCRQSKRMGMVANRLEGSALIWYHTLKAQCRLEGKTLRWDDFKPLFIVKHEGRDQQLLQRQEMKTLVLGKGRCGDLHKLEAEFDRLRLMVFPGSELNEELNSTLGEWFASAIERGDQQLYFEMLDRGDTIPKSLTDWKQLAEKVTLLRANKKLAEKARGGSNRHTHSAYQQSVRANRVQVGEGENAGEEGEGETWERVEGQQEVKATVQTAAVSKPPRRGIRLSDNQRTQLRKAGRCFTCYKKQEKLSDGRWHTFLNCPVLDKDLPRRLPNNEELNC
jgi:hypothetical protein